MVKNTASCYNHYLARSVAVHGLVDDYTGLPYDPPTFDGLWIRPNGDMSMNNWDDAAAAALCESQPGCRYMGYYETMKKGEFMAAPWEPYLSSEANRYANLFGVCVSSDAKVEPGPQEPEPCVDDPMGYVAADAHTSCSDVDALGGSWQCDSLDPDFNGVQNIYVYELCPRSCGRCGSDEKGPQGPEPCVEGFTGPSCWPCMDGVYGRQCSFNCTCGRHGRCQGRDGSCTCFAGWGGPLCETRAPDPQALSSLVNASVQHCSVPFGWDDLVNLPEFRTRFKTGGLGRRMVPGRFEVWVCDRFDACVPDGKHDLMCYAYDEWTKNFVPLSLNSEIKFVKRQSLTALSAGR